MRPSKLWPVYVALVALGVIGSGVNAGAAQAARAAPDNFSVKISAAPILINISAPAAIPFEIEVGLAYSAIKLDNSPLIVAESGPVHVPLVTGLGLLGGADKLGTLIKTILPDILVGLPRIIGLDRLPIDPAKISVPELKIKQLPELFCMSFFPGDPRSEDCALRGGSLLGVGIGNFAGRTASQGDSANPGSLSSTTSASFAGIHMVTPLPGFPISIGTISSAASVKIVDGKIVADATLTIEGINIGNAVRIPRTVASVSGTLGGTSETASATQRACALPPGTVSVATGGGEGVHSGVRAAELDIGSGQLLHSVEKKPVVSPDGTTLTASSACLEGSWTIPASGTKLRFSMGELKLEMSASNDADLDVLPDVDPLPPGVQGTLSVANIGNLRSTYAGFMALTLGVVVVVCARRSGGYRRRATVRRV